MDAREVHLTAVRCRTTSMTIDTVKQTLQLGPSSNENPAGFAATATFVVAGLLIIWSSYIHLHLWQSLGYRHIATIGPLFLLQSIGGFLLGLLILGARRVWAAVLGAGFAVSTMVGFLISVEYGLFGFNDTWSAPFAHEAFALEIGIISVCIIAGALCLIGSTSVTEVRRISVGLLSAGVAVALGAVILLAVGGGGGASPSSASGASTSSGSSRATTSAHITISNFMFDPMTVTVSPGAVVSVTNEDSATHTLTASAGQFNTGDITQNRTKTFKAPMRPGRYSYICDIHQYMMGAIVVK
jgi:plastocyanin